MKGGVQGGMLPPHFKATLIEFLRDILVPLTSSNTLQLMGIWG